MFNARGLSVAFNEHFVLRDIDFDIKSGACVALIGENGSGKSTLCECLLGVIPEEHPAKVTGILLVADRQTDSPDFREFRRHWGFALENPEAQFVSLSVAEEIALTSVAADQAVSQATIQNALDCFGISTLIDRDLQTLSEGEKQRVTLAAIEILQPCVMVLDDPTAALDADGRAIFLEFISRARERGTTTVFSSHDMELASSAQRYLGLKNGHIVANRLLSDQTKVICDTKVFPGIQTPIPCPPGRQHSIGVDDFALQARNISFSYSKRSKQLLKDIDIELRPSDVLVVRGSNGSGKTTLLYLLAGLLRPAAGSIRICGLSPQEIRMQRRGEFYGLAFQNPEHQLLMQEVGAELCSAVPQSLRTSGEVMNALAWISSFLPLPQASRDPHSLSLGQKKIVTLTTAIMPNPRLLLLDEPELGLDPVQKERMAQMLEMIRVHWETAIVVVTHDATFLRHLNSAKTLDLEPHANS